MDIFVEAVQGDEYRRDQQENAVLRKQVDKRQGQSPEEGDVAGRKRGTTGEPEVAGIVVRADLIRSQAAETDLDQIGSSNRCQLHHAREDQHARHEALAAQQPAERAECNQRQAEQKLSKRQTATGKMIERFAHAYE